MASKSTQWIYQEHNVVSIGMEEMMNETIQRLSLENRLTTGCNVRSLNMPLFYRDREGLRSPSLVMM